MANGIRVGAVQPQAFTFTVTPGKSGVDLTTVTAVTLQLQKPSGATTEWPTSIVSQTPTQLVARHTHPPGPSSEVDERGPWQVYAELDVPGGELVTEATTLFAFGPFDVPTGGSP